MDPTSFDSSESMEMFETVDILASDFVARCRDGQRPTIEEYARRHPDLSDPIRRMFPLIASVERIKANEQTAVDGGATLAGHSISKLDDYRIVREIGRGGMGIVFEAVQESLGRSVAVKVLPKQSLLDDESLARFQREARTAAAMHHTNIVPIYGSGESDGSHYLVMQLVRGESLDTILAQNDSPLPIQDIARIGLQTADAIAYAHAAGVLHRDIKPANILIEEDGTAQITDFGLAKNINENVTVTQAVSGSLRYMAPERFSGISDERCDVYSLGLTLYELLTHQPAFQESEPEPLIQAITQRRIKPIRSVREDLPIDLETIVMKAISAEPSGRYQTAKELHDDLSRYISDEPIKARRVSPIAKCVRWCRRNRGLGTAIAVTTTSLVLATIVSSFAYWHTKKANRIAMTALESSENTASLALESLDGIVELVSVPSSAVDFELPQPPEAKNDSTKLTTGLPDVSLTVSASEMAILERVQPLYQRLFEQSPTRPDIVLQMMDASVQLARIQNQLGNPDRAIETLQRALGILRSDAKAAQVPAREIQLRDVRLNNELGMAHTAALDYASADACYQAAIKAAQSLPVSDHPGQIELARAFLMLGDFALPRRRNSRTAPDETENQLENVDTAIQVLDRLHSSTSDQKSVRILRARALLAKSRLTIAPKAKQDLYQAAIAILHQQLNETPKDASIRFELVQSLADVDIRRNNNRNSDEDHMIIAEERLKQALEELQPLRRGFPATPAFAVKEVHLRHRLSSIARAHNHSVEAKRQLEEAIKLQTALLDSSPSSMSHRCWRALLYRSQAELAREQGDLALAMSAIEHASDDLDAVSSDASADPLYIRTKRTIEDLLGNLSEN